MPQREKFNPIAPIIKVSFWFPWCHACPNRTYLLHNEQKMMAIDCMDHYMSYFDDVLSEKAVARKVQSHICDHFWMNDQTCHQSFFLIPLIPSLYNLSIIKLAGNDGYWLHGLLHELLGWCAKWESCSEKSSYPFLRSFLNECSEFSLKLLFPSPDTMLVLI